MQREEGFVLAYFDGRGGKPEYGTKLHYDLETAHWAAADTEAEDVMVLVVCNQHRAGLRSGSCHYCAMLQEAPQV